MKFAATHSHQAQLKIITLALSSIFSLVISSESLAQSNFGSQLFKTAVDTVKKKEPTQATQQPVNNNQDTGNLTAGAMPQNKAIPDPVATYSNSSAFLDAARKGAFISLGESGTNDVLLDDITHSVINILRNEYGVAPLPNDSVCYASFKASVLALMSRVTSANTKTLSQQAPDFVRPDTDDRSSDLSNEIAEFQRAGGWCDTKISGVYRAHSYKQAFPKFLSEYQKATLQWVETERSNRKSNYQKQLAAVKLEDEQKHREDSFASKNIEGKAASSNGAESRVTNCVDGICLDSEIAQHRNLNWKFKIGQPLDTSGAHMFAKQEVNAHRQNCIVTMRKQMNATEATRYCELDESERVSVDMMKLLAEKNVVLCTQGEKTNEFSVLNTRTIVTTRNASDGKIRIYKIAKMYELNDADSVKALAKNLQEKHPFIRGFNDEFKAPWGGSVSVMKYGNRVTYYLNANERNFNPSSNAACKKKESLSVD